MIDLGAFPIAGRLVAVLARGLAVVDCGSRLAGLSKAGGGMASGALGGKRHTGVQLARRPVGVTGFVTSVAVGDRHATQRFVGDVVGRGTVGRREASGVASGALVGDRLLGVVPLGGFPGGCAVAAYAVCGGCEVLGIFSSCGTTVVATGAIRCAIEEVVVDLCAGPGRSGLVAAFAGTLPVVNRGVGFSSEAKAGRRMAGCALRRDGHTGVQLTWSPACVTGFVASVAVGDRHTTQRLVGDMVGRRPVGRRKASSVTGSALVGNRLLGVVPLGGFPGGCAVAAHAVDRGGHVLGVLAGGIAAVMATCAIGG